MTLRLLAVHAHPDDESSKGAGSYAFYRSVGADVLVVSCTGGEMGDVQNDGLAEKAMAERDMAGLRRIEMARAQQILGVQHRWLGYYDSGLPEEGEAVPAGSFSLIPLDISAAALVKLIREYRPQVMVTYDESGGYPHPDHIRTHELAVYALEAAADPSRYADLGDAWQISKLYYDRIFSTARTNRVYDELVASEPDSPLIAQFDEMRTWMRDRPYLATTQVDVGAFFEHRDRALRAHASQVAPDSQFFFWPNDIQRRAWPFEDFQLVTSLVETELPETDLFAGIVDDQKADA
ncbi:MAG: mycothiol S-conjugate amidase [Microbacteriaceae bacterium]|nr:mycothiol S-conjugate amidase [Microbacteriaceae bacterium]